VGGWGIILALLGLAHRYLGRATPGLRYLGASAYPFYILHQAAVVGIGYGVIGLPLSIGAKHALLLVSALAATLMAYEVLLRRAWPFCRALGKQALAGLGRHRLRTGEERFG
jgi:peptidoglycan/LPS O-acetylase OafA/YrhL